MIRIKNWHKRSSSRSANRVMPHPVHWWTGYTEAGEMGDTFSIRLIGSEDTAGFQDQQIILELDYDAMKELATRLVGKLKWKDAMDLMANAPEAKPEVIWDQGGE